MITEDSIKTAYCFFHQKYRVYEYSNNEIQKDDIEYAISSYVDDMNRELFDYISDGNYDFLKLHKTFGSDMSHAIERLEQLSLMK